MELNKQREGDVNRSFLKWLVGLGEACMPIPHCSYGELGTVAHMGQILEPQDITPAGHAGALVKPLSYT